MFVSCLTFELLAEVEERFVRKIAMFVQCLSIVPSRSLGFCIWNKVALSEKNERRQQHTARNASGTFRFPDAHTPNISYFHFSGFRMFTCSRFRISDIFNFQRALMAKTLRNGKTTWLLAVIENPILERELALRPRTFKR